MTSTKKLCRMLDELGVEYETDVLPNGECGVSWIDGNDIEWEAIQRGENFEIHALQLVTPEQAVAATVGRSCASCPEMDNPDSYIMHLHRALEVADRGAGTIEKATERIEVLSGFAREYLHRYGMLMSMAGEDVTDEVLAMESVINEVCGRKVVDE